MVGRFIQGASVGPVARGLGLIAALGGALACADGLSAAPSAASARREAAARGPEIGLRRGASWSTLMVKPPNLVGPTATFILRNGTLSGIMAAGYNGRLQQTGGGVHVRIERDGADGYAPAGPVALDFRDDGGNTEVTGTWNGFRVHLEIGDKILAGTVAQAVSVSTSGLGAPAGVGIADYATCQYTLGETALLGALAGPSSCDGMPEPTRLEVPPVVRDYLTRQELAVVLVAMLSSPPRVASEIMSGDMRF